MLTEEETRGMEDWWRNLSATFKSMPAPTKPGEIVESNGMKFRAERWRDGLTFEWCLSWTLLGANGESAHITGSRVVDSNQSD